MPTLRVGCVCYVTYVHTYVSTSGSAQQPRRWLDPYSAVARNGGCGHRSIRWSLVRWRRSDGNPTNFSMSRCPLATPEREPENPPNLRPANKRTKRQSTCTKIWQEEKKEEKRESERRKTTASFYRHSQAGADYTFTIFSTSYLKSK